MGAQSRIRLIESKPTVGDKKVQIAIGIEIGIDPDFDPDETVKWSRE